MHVPDNFQHDLSTNIMAQTFEGFKYLYMKAPDMKIHLNKR